jgi:hypothetical protein
MRDHPEITICVHGLVGIGKSAVALAIIDALRACGVECQWSDESSERNLGTGADDIAALSPKPRVRLIETNPTMGSLADAAQRIIDDAPPATPAGTCVFVWKHHLDRLRDAIAIPPPSPSYDAPRAWTAQEKIDAAEAMRRIREREAQPAAPGGVDDAAVERRARELLAAEYDKDELPFVANCIRTDAMLTGVESRSVRAVVAALTAAGMGQAIDEEHPELWPAWLQDLVASHAQAATDAARECAQPAAAGVPQRSAFQMVEEQEAEKARNPAYIVDPKDGSFVPMESLGRDAVPEGFAIVPRELTAENGAKAEFMGETFGGDAVSWTAVKAVHRAVVKWAEGARHG